MLCINPIEIKGHKFPCGRCMPCRLNRTAEWTLRLSYELQCWETAAFVTLTYNDTFVPKAENGRLTLVKSDLQKFIKRLRKNSGLKLKYFAVGEYGSAEKTHRPHFHLIIFGLNPLNQKHRDFISEAWPFCDQELWTYRRRHNAIDVVNVHDIAYVCGYVQKKLYGHLADKEYDGILPPFSVMSQGLGLEGFLSPTFPNSNSLDIFQKVLESGQYHGTFVENLKFLPMFKSKKNLSSTTIIKTKQKEKEPILSPELKD